VEVRTGQLWEFTDRSGAARLARVVRVSEAIAGVRHVYLRRVGSGMNMRSTVQRLERQIDGVRLVEDSDGLQPPAPAPDRRERVVVEVPRSKGLLQPRMSAEVRREAIAAAKRMQARGCTAREIGETLSVLPEIVEDWLRDLPVTK
jgi:hypothetical protein